ncbi:MAG: hypothetical protein Q8903_15210, partial [Bacteroidota bacterium]|nr:hypothetical protein [Bacteroidota bacterium]
QNLYKKTAALIVPMVTKTLSIRPKRLRRNKNFQLVTGRIDASEGPQLNVRNAFPAKDKTENKREEYGHSRLSP